MLPFGSCVKLDGFDSHCGLTSLLFDWENAVKRTFIVKHPLQATMMENKDHTRTFQPGETVWCDADQTSGSVIFEADLVQFEAALIEFAKNVEAPVPEKLP
jgi:hypothetical protein